MRISAKLWHEEFELLDESYSVSDIQDYFEYIFKKHGKVTNNPSIMIYVSKIENCITFKIKTEYYIDLLTPETVKLLGSTKINITKYKKGEHVPHLEITWVILVNCNIVNNNFKDIS